ncbi:hypothetical protein TRAPUB_10392, partial [Trametes pubescens]
RVACTDKAKKLCKSKTEKKTTCMAKAERSEISARWRKSEEEEKRLREPVGTKRERERGAERAWVWGRGSEAGSNEE